MMIDYQNLFHAAVLTTDPLKLRELDFVCRVALNNYNSYRIVSLRTGIPWPVIAAIHFRESNQCFLRHLHNGDPLTARTTHVPIGRPKTGYPPFTWTDSATDALTDLWKPKAWDMAGCLDFCEHYNGYGYAERGVMTPYLWDWTDHYLSGLFDRDGQYDPKLTENRPGVVSIFKALAERNVTLPSLTLQ